MGLEASGEVEEVGEGVTGFKVGEKVMSLLDGGGWVFVFPMHSLIKLNNI